MVEFYSSTLKFLEGQIDNFFIFSFLVEKSRFMSLLGRPLAMVRRCPS